MIPDLDDLTHDVLMLAHASPSRAELDAARERIAAARADAILAALDGQTTVHGPLTLTWRTAGPVPTVIPQLDPAERLEARYLVPAPLLRAAEADLADRLGIRVRIVERGNDTRCAVVVA